MAEALFHLVANLWHVRRFAGGKIRGLVIPLLHRDLLDGEFRGRDHMDFFSPHTRISPNPRTGSARSCVSRGETRSVTSRSTAW
jgi:hypothetical protein